MRRAPGILLFFGFLLLPLLASAQSPFAGTWKVDMNKVDFSRKPDVYVLQNGMYQCKTCVPPIDIKADGQDQKVTGHPYYDTMAIKVVNDHEIEETDKKDGKVVGTSKTTAAPDDKTLTFEFTDSSNTNGSPVTGKGEATRVAAGPAGSNAISGSWRTTKMENISDNAITWTYKVNGDDLTMTSPTGQTYTAKMNGPEAPMQGDPGITTVSVKAMGKNTIEETDMRDGKVIGVAKSTVAGDGKTMHIEYENKLTGQNMKYVATKQ
jgi:hypothetical protein